MEIKKAILYNYLLFCALITTSAKQDGTVFSCHNNVAIYDTEVSFSTTTEREILCGFECFLHGHCNSFDYNNITKECHMVYQEYEQQRITRENTKLCISDMSGADHITHIICGEATQPTMSCANGYIRIVYANFGRTKPDSEVCPSGYHNDDTNCYLPSYQPRLAAACDGQTSCQLVEKSTDPCYGTAKYYNVTYVCEM